MEELRDSAALRAACSGDPLLLWVAQDFRTGARAWTTGAATAVAGPAVSKRDRLAIQGEPTSVITLLRQILPEVGPSFRTIGDRDLVHLVVRELVELDVVLEFGWMDTTAPPSIRTHDAEWLDEDHVDEIGRLLDRAFPDSYARPCEPGVSRWAGCRVNGGLAAVAADAWSCADLGFIAGAATDPNFRSQRLAERVCGLVSHTLVSERGRAALIADTWNTAAIALYRRLGLGWRDLAAARVGAGGY
jgi:ribosomal protein S18 acetylase RimI-like enzyme